MLYIAVQTSTLPKLRPIELDINNDANFQLDFLTAATNLRARTYDIREIDHGKIKKVAYSIVPSLPTTNAMVVGAVCIEIYKYYCSTIS